MAVEGWEPPASMCLDAETVAQFVAAAAQLQAPEFGLSADAVARLAAFARQGPAIDWASAVDDLTSDEVASLIQSICCCRSAECCGGMESP